MSDKTIGNLKVKLSLDSSDFHKNINKIKGNIDEIKTKSTQALNNISTTVKGKIDGLTDKFDEMKKSGNYLTSALGEIGSNLIEIVTPARVVTAAIAAIGIAFWKTINVGSEMNQTFEKMQVATGATGKTLNGLEKSLKRVIEASSSTADVLGSAFSNINTYLGLTGKNLENLTILIAKYADITGENAESTSAIVSKLFNNWHINVNDYEKTMNVLFGITQNTGISLEELAQQLLDNGSTFRKVGFSIEDAAIQLSAFNKYGYYATTATDILYSALDHLTQNGIKPTKENYEALISQLVNTQDINLASSVFGTSYYAYEAIDALQNTSKEVKSLTKNIDNYKNSLNESIELQRGGASEAWIKFSNKLANTAEIIFEALEPAITILINSLSFLVDKIAIGINIILKLISIALLPIKAEIEILKKIATDFYETILKPIYDWVTNFIDSCEPLKAIFDYLAGIGEAIGNAWDWLTGNEKMDEITESIDDAKNAMNEYCNSLDSAIDKTNQLSGTNINDPYVNSGMNYHIENGYKIYSDGTRVANNTSYYNNITVQSNGYPSEEMARIYAYNKAMDALKARY